MRFSEDFIVRAIVTTILCFATTQLAAQTVSAQDYNKLVVMKYMEAYGTSLRRNAEQEYLSEDYERIRSEFHNMQYHALDSELMESAEPLHTSIQNRRDSVDVIMAEGDAVAVRYKINGTHAGNLYGIPATGKSFEIDAGAIFWLADGKISKSWFMADEAGLLKQIGQPLPARKDGRWEAAPHVFSAITGDQHIKELLENPVDSQPYRNKLMINAYKSKNPPEGILPPPEEYGLGLRRGFANLAGSATPEMAEKYPFGGAFPDREDMIVKMMADGKWVMILFRLTATNSESLFGIPALDRKVDAYEFGFMEFDGEDWAYRWFFGDDLGMLLQMGGPQDYWFTGGQ
ncbi:MAG: ester cyclase [Acidiferrobacterales bacterium]|nr:ester cyclase [Acidiferrobacterales bacterium]